MHNIEKLELREAYIRRPVYPSVKQKHKTNLMKSLYIYIYKLPLSIKESPSVEIFKKRIKTY